MMHLKTLLERNKGVYDRYKINTTRTQSYELFFVHNSLQTVRATDTETANVTLYVDHDGKTGHSTFAIYASSSDAEIEKKILDAAQKARKIFNEPYILPENEVLNGEIPSNFDSFDSKELAEKISDAVFASNILEHGSINALEIFINALTVTVCTNTGVNKTEHKYSGMLEAIPTWNEGESVELYEAMRFNSFDPTAITDRIYSMLCQVRDRSKATAPQTKPVCPVVLPASELASMIGELTDMLHYSAVYSHTTPFAIGDAVQKDLTGDALTVTMRGALAGSVRSALFDSDGVTLTDATVILDAHVSAFYGSTRFAQYLGVAPTGNLGCTEVQAGTLTDEERDSAPYFECASMSGLQVDVLNDYIGGEVRLGYYFDGERRIPMTGISISGRLSDALRTLRLSREVVTHGAYRGPRYGLMNGVAVV